MMVRSYPREEAEPLASYPIRKKLREKVSFLIMFSFPGPRLPSATAIAKATARSIDIRARVSRIDVVIPLSRSRLTKASWACLVDAVQMEPGVGFKKSVHMNPAWPRLCEFIGQELRTPLPDRSCRLMSVLDQTRR